MRCHLLAVPILLSAAIPYAQAPVAQQQQNTAAPQHQRAPQPQQHGGGPWNNDLMIRWSADKQSFGPESVFVESGGVPSVTASENGILVAAFQWFPFTRMEAFDRVTVRFSETGGISWSDPVPIQVNGLPAGFQRPFDPTIVALPGKAFRMYFSGGPKGPGLPGTGANICTYSARSDDGIHYDFEPGVRFTVKDHRVIDCAVAWDGRQWLYIAPIGRPDEGAYAATSPDGLTFTRLHDVPSSNGYNWTGNLLRIGERLRFFGGSHQGIWWAECTAPGNWSAPHTIGLRGGDPAAGIGKDGKLFIIYVSTPKRNAPSPLMRTGAPAQR
ncbi:MAG: hypothetical protein ACR2IE_11160 [Candidatus Sumerlaeaceae bacterium]